MMEEQRKPLEEVNCPHCNLATPLWRVRCIHCQAALPFQGSAGASREARTSRSIASRLGKSA